MSTPHRRWGLWVLVLLLVPGAMWASGVRPNELPGNATTSPSWDPGRLLDDDYYREIDTWLAARTPSPALCARTLRSAATRERSIVWWRS